MKRKMANKSRKKGGKGAFKRRKDDQEGGRNLRKQIPKVNTK